MNIGVSKAQVRRSISPLQPRKRQLDSTESDPSSPTKRAREVRQDTQQPGADDKQAGQTDGTTLPQPNPNPSLHSFVTEWLRSVGSDRERSDSPVHPSTEEPFPGELTRLALEMAYQGDADGFTATPASTRSRTSPRASDSTSASVRRPAYRGNNLARNNICFRDFDALLPRHVVSRVEQARAGRDSPGPSSEQMAGFLAELKHLARRGCNEAQVRRFLRAAVFPTKLDAGLDVGESSLVSAHLLPKSPGTAYRVSGPKPDLLYGYSGRLEDGAFTHSQFLGQELMHPQNAEFPQATSQSLRFPFLAVEVKGDGGDLFTATNQGAGAASACLNAVHRLNVSLQEHRHEQQVDNLAYCIAVDNKVAEIYASWKEGDSTFYLQQVDAFMLLRSDELNNFRRQVRNILDWGKGARLTQIREALDTIVEDDDRKMVADLAESRQPPADTSTTTTTTTTTPTGKKRESAPSRRGSTRGSTRGSSVQGRSDRASGTDLDREETTLQRAPATPGSPLRQLLNARSSSAHQEMNKRP